MKRVKDVSRYKNTVLIRQTFLEIPVTSAKFYHEHLEEYSSMYLFGVDIMTTKGMHAKNVLNALTSLLKTPFIDRHHDSLISPVQLELF